MYLILIWLMLKEGIAVCSLLSNFPYRADSFSATTTLPLQATNKCVFNELLIDSLTQKGCVGSCVPALPTALPAPSPDYERTQEEDREITYYSSLSWHAPHPCLFYKLPSFTHSEWGWEQVFLQPSSLHSLFGHGEKKTKCVELLALLLDRSLKNQKVHDIFLVCCLGAFTLTSISGQWRTADCVGWAGTRKRNATSSSKTYFSILWQLLSNKTRCS